MGSPGPAGGYDSDSAASADDDEGSNEPAVLEPGKALQPAGGPSHPEPSFQAAADGSLELPEPQLHKTKQPP